ncbi:MAG: GSCFA domain protein [Crocinitomix sp.]|nr:GSCFA domain protein [Crocinitomix sp.]
MKFRTAVKIDANKGFINHQHKMMSIGSCFASNIGAYLNVRQFNIEQVQFGIQFNPVSIERNIRDAISGTVDEKLVVARDEHFYHYNYSANHFAKTQAILTNLLRNVQIDFTQGLESCDRLFLTFGTAWVYRLVEQNEIVSNCHKIPQNQFKKELLDLEELKHLYVRLFEDLNSKKPELQIVLTVSPVRHVKNGLHENNLSKSILLLLSDFLVQKFDFVHYFPAYEIVMDDLRDYRFFNSDLIHPNTQAVDYIFERFQETYFNKVTAEISVLAKKLIQLKSHRPSAPSQAQTKQARQQQEALETEILELKSKA